MGGKRKQKNRSSSSSSNNNTSNSKKTRKDHEQCPPPPPIPVTILSGFLGSGKTTLLQHILTSKEHKLKIAVIVNDMAELNIDGQTIQDERRRTAETSTVVQTKREVVTLENGCICCTLRGDLIREINRIQEMSRHTQQKFDYVIIESTGIAEPQQVAESFCIDPTTQALAANQTQMLYNTARLDACITVVDAVNFPTYLSSLKRFQDVFDDGIEDAPDEEAQKSISELMIEQVEFANIILLNKIDLVTSSKEIDITKKLIENLNPKALVMTGSYGKIDVQQILNTRLFNLEEAKESPGWLQSLQQNGGVTASEGEADEYGVSSMVYRTRKPFHPLRLHLFLERFFCFAEDWNNNSTTASSTLAIDGDEDNNNHDEGDGKLLAEKYGSILRSKGTCWIAGRDDYEIGWSQAGKIIQLSPIAPWYCTTPQEEWEGADTPEDIARIKAKFHHKKDDIDSDNDNNDDDNDAELIPYPYGDRRQEVVLIGTDLQPKAIEGALNECLLSQQEMKDYNPSSLPVGSYPDPLQPPLLVPCDSAKSLFMIARHNQNQHLQIVPGFTVTIQNLALHIPAEQDDNNNDVAIKEDDIRAVKVWLDKSDDVNNHGILLATLRPITHEQYPISLSLLPCDEEGGEQASNRRLRVEIVLAAAAKKKKKCSLSSADLMRAAEVHVMGKIEPLAYQEDNDGDDGEDGGDQEMEEEEDCATGVCQ